MERIELDGDLGPLRSFDLDLALGPITSSVRPSVTVDLSAATDIHPSVASVLIRHQRQARRQSGDVLVIAPKRADARRTLDQVGIISLSPMPA